MKIIITLFCFFFMPLTFAKNKDVLLKNGYKLTISDCLSVELDELMFNKVSFKKYIFISKNKSELITNICHNNLLDELYVKYIDIAEKVSVLESPFDNLKTQKITNDLIEIYLKTGKQFDKYATFIIFIQDKFNKDKLVTISGWPSGNNKKENFSHVCKFISQFMEANNVLNIKKKITKYDICKQSGQSN